jgi:hypothetical protein
MQSFSEDIDKLEEGIWNILRNFSQRWSGNIQGIEKFFLQLLSYDRVKDYALVRIGYWRCINSR